MDGCDRSINTSVCFTNYAFVSSNVFFIQNTLQNDSKNVERLLFGPNIEEYFIVKKCGDFDLQSC